MPPPQKKCIYSIPVQETAKHSAKFGWSPLIDVAAVTKPRHKTRWNLLECPKLANRSQPLVGRSSPYYKDIWRRYCHLTVFFRLSIHALIAKIYPNEVVRWCADGDFCVLYFKRAACGTFQTRILICSEAHHVWKYGRHPISDRWDWARKKRRKKERNHRTKI